MEMNRRRRIAIRFELPDFERQRGKVGTQLQFDRRNPLPVFPQRQDLCVAASANIIIAADAVIEDTPLFDEVHGRGKDHDVVAAARRAPRSAQRGPAGTLNHPLMAQRRERSHATMSETNRIMQRSCLARTDDRVPQRRDQPTTCKTAATLAAELDASGEGDDVLGRRIVAKTNALRDERT